MRTFVALALVVAGCVDKGPGPQPKKIEPGYVGKHLLTAPPANLTAALDVTLGGKVVYLGNTVDATRIAPGAVVKIIHYWKVIAPPGPGWNTFTLFRGDAGQPDFMALPDTDMGIAHGPSTWRAGEIIEDPQEITLRPDWRSVTATLSVGLIATGAHGVGDRMAAQGPKVVDNAVIARVFEVDLSKAPPPPGTIHVPYARGPIVIDGVAGDLGWSGALTSPELVTAEGSPDPVGKAIARLTWDDQNLYAFISITDSDVFSEYKKHDDPLWKADCVELFIDADGNKRGYVELQVNPNNATFDSWFAQGRAAKGDEAWDSGMTTAVTMRGTPDQGGDVDTGWDVEIAIPWAAVKGRDPAMSVITPPRVGDRWKLNVVRVDKKTGDQNPAASSWNRITYSDFHALDRMLTVVFADPSGGTAPGTPVGPAASGSNEGSGAGSGSAGSASAEAAGSGGAGSGGAGSGSAGSGGAGSGSGGAGSGGAGSGGAGSGFGAGSAVNLKRSGLTPGFEAEGRNTATILVTIKGEHVVNGSQVKDADLSTVLRTLFARNPKLEVAVVLEQGVGQDKSVHVLNVVKAVGITKVAVKVTPPSTP